MSNTYRWLTPLSQIFLERDYLLPGQTLDQRVDIICNRAEQILGIPGFAARFKANLQKGWYSLSTPIWTNFGTERGLPISCFGSHIDDDMESILQTHAEVGMMTKHGGGTSAYFGDLRHRGASITGNGHSSGAVHFMGLYDSEIDIISQGSTRRGSFAAYLPIEHPDIEEFLQVRGDGNALQRIYDGVTVSDTWLEAMIAGDKEKRRVWGKLLAARSSKGTPYIFFTDNANNGTVDVYKDLGLKIRHSNLCTEIMLPDNRFESFVCDLSSMNVLHFDEWRDTDAVELLVFFLDAVMSEFIAKGADVPFLERAVRFATRHRAIGVGWIGWHSYLQSKLIPFESFEANLANVNVAVTMKAQAYAASAKLAALYGEPEVLKGYGRRNTTLLAIAPTQSSAMILGQVSQGIEPRTSNYYIKDTAKGQFTIRNPALVPVLERYGCNTEETWQSILERQGSVQHLGFLTPHEREVFLTYNEISPMAIINQAAQRQKHIDQGQSLNLFIAEGTPAKDINALVLHAWRNGIKSLYYQHTSSAAESLGRSVLECKSCSS